MDNQKNEKYALFATRIKVDLRYGLSAEAEPPKQPILTASTYAELLLKIKLYVSQACGEVTECSETSVVFLTSDLTIYGVIRAQD